MLLALVGGRNGISTSKSLLNTEIYIYILFTSLYLHITSMCYKSISLKKKKNKRLTKHLTFYVNETNTFVGNIVVLFAYVFYNALSSLCFSEGRF